MADDPRSHSCVPWLLTQNKEYYINVQKNSVLASIPWQQCVWQKAEFCESARSFTQPWDVGLHCPPRTLYPLYYSPALGKQHECMIHLHLLYAFVFWYISLGLCLVCLPRCVVCLYKLLNATCNLKCNLTMQVIIISCSCIFLLLFNLSETVAYDEDVLFRSTYM